MNHGMATKKPVRSLTKCPWLKMINDVGRIAGRIVVLADMLAGSGENADTWAGYVGGICLAVQYLREAFNLKN